METKSESCLQELMSNSRMTRSTSTGMCSWKQKLKYSCGKVKGTNVAQKGTAKNQKETDHIRPGDGAVDEHRLLPATRRERSIDPSKELLVVRAASPVCVQAVSSGDCPCIGLSHGSRQKWLI